MTHLDRSRVALSLTVALAGCGPTAPLDVGGTDGGADDVSTLDAPTVSDAPSVDAHPDVPVELDAPPRPDTGVPMPDLRLVRGGPGEDLFNGVSWDGADRVAVGGTLAALSELERDCGLTSIRAGDDGAGLVAVYDLRGACLWSRLVGTDAMPSRVHDVAYLDDGTLIVVGSHQGTIDLGDGPTGAVGVQDAFVARYDAEGTLLWSRRFGAVGQPMAVSGLAVDGSAIVVAGGYSGTVDFGDRSRTAGIPTSTYVVALEHTGETRWSASFGAGRDAGAAVALDDRGRLFLAGGFGGDIDLGGGTLTSNSPAPDVFVASLAASDGAHRWSQRYGSAGTEAARAILVTADGELIVAGAYDTSIDFGGGVLAGSFGFDAFVVALDADRGTHRRSGRFVGLGDQLVSTLVATDDGYVVAGALDGATDFAGSATATSATGGFLARFDTTGGFVGARVLGEGGATGIADGVAVGTRLVVVGSTRAAIDLGAGAIPTAGGADGFLAALSL